MKIGGFNRSERVNKINRLIEIEQYLNERELLVNLSEQNGDIKFITDLEIPDEHAEALETYRQSVDEKLQKSPPKGK